MARVWTYTPNEYTTSMTFTVTFVGGGSPAVFTYSLVGGDWTLTDGSISDLDVQPTQSNISITDNGSVKKIECLCSNGSITNPATTIDVKRVTILKEPDFQHGRLNYTVYGLLDNSYGEDPWQQGGIPDMGDITFTNLTEDFTIVPHDTINAQFDGIAIINPTAKKAINGSKEIKSIWCRWKNNIEGNWYDIPNIDSEFGQSINCDMTSLKSIPYPEYGLFAFPVIYYSGSRNSKYDPTIYQSDGSADYTADGFREEMSLRKELNPNRYNNNN